MADQVTQQARAEFPLWLAIGLSLLMLAALPVGFYLLSPTRADMRLCDETIMANLKAPATYKRIKGAGAFDSPMSIYKVTYDAENGFGVPLRSEGWCQFEEGHSKAVWTEAYHRED